MNISLFGSCIHTENWLRIYDNLATDQVEFEIIFAGPNKPTFTLPDNFRYIHATVCPVQCWAVASREAKGDLVALIADDMLFSHNALEKVWKTHNTHKEKQHVISSDEWYKVKNDVRTLNQKMSSRRRDVQRPIVGFYERSLFWELGGYDKRFVAGFADYYLWLRAKALYPELELLIANVHFDECDDRSCLHKNYGHLDVNTFNSLRSNPISYETFDYKSDLCHVNQTPDFNWS